MPVEIGWRDIPNHKTKHRIARHGPPDGPATQYYTVCGIHLGATLRTARTARIMRCWKCQKAPSPYH